MNNNMKDEDIIPLSPEEIKAIGSIGIGPSKQDIFLNRHYRKLILAGIIAATAASLAIAYFSHNQDQRDEAGAQVVAGMKTDTLAISHPTADYDARVLETLRSEYANTPSAATAALLENLSLLSGSEEQAKAGAAGLEALANDGTIPQLLRARALCALGTVSMSKGDEATAATHWNALLSLGESPYSALAYMSLGDIAKNAGKPDEARQHYQNAITNCPTSQLVQDHNAISTRLMLLDVDAPRPVAPAPQPGTQANPFASPFDSEPTPVTPATPASRDVFTGGSTLPSQP